MKILLKISVVLFSVLLSCNQVAELFDSGQEPVLGEEGIVLDKNSTTPYDTVTAWISARNPESGPLRFEWSVSNGGRILPPTDEDTIRWVAPAPGGVNCTFYVKVSNQSKSVDAPPKQIYVQSITNPLVNISTPIGREHFLLGETIAFVARVEHPDDLNWIKLFVNLGGNNKLLDSVGVRQSPYIYQKKIMTSEEMVGLREFMIEAEAKNTSKKLGHQAVLIYVEGVIPGDAGQR